MGMFKASPTRLLCSRKLSNVILQNRLNAIRSIAESKSINILYSYSSRTLLLLYVSRSLYLCYSDMYMCYMLLSFYGLFQSTQGSDRRRAENCSINVVIL